MNRNIAVYGGETLLHIEFDIPTTIIIKEKSPTGNPINPRSTYGWKVNYKDRYFGDWVYLTDDISNRKDKVTQAILKEVFQVVMEQAEERFLHRVLLTEIDNRDMLEELKERLDKKYYPVYATSDTGYYCMKDEVGKRVWKKKFSSKYLVMVIRRWFANKVLNLLRGLLS